MTSMDGGGAPPFAGLLIGEVKAYRVIWGYNILVAIFLIKFKIPKNGGTM